MAKLYAELTSDKGGRIASKGGSELLTIKIYDGNSYILSIDYKREEHELHINDDTENLVINVDGYTIN